MLVLHARDDPAARYSAYLEEILRTEGFTTFDRGDLASLDDALAVEPDIVLLPRCFPSHAQRHRLLKYVAGGGTLVAFQPEATLAQALGLQPTWTSIGPNNGWLRIETGNPICSGLAEEAVQTIVPVAIWRPEPGRPVDIWGTVSDARHPERKAPAVVHVRHGQGRVGLVAWDLPHGIARLRQGDPNLADIYTSGTDQFYRPHELIAGHLPPGHQHVPQADVQTALLARIIETLAPCPRVWYYPEPHQRSVIVMTSDDDWSTPEQFETLIAGLARYDATCTFFIVPGTRITHDQMHVWEAAGHAFSTHPAVAGDYRAGPPPELPQARFVSPMIRENVERHRREYGHAVRTLRNHIIRWSGYLEPAYTLAELGVRMEFNYFSVMPLPVGHLCGSGRPMRFVETDGTVIDCFQQPTTWSEECLIHPEFNASAQWHLDRAIRETDRIIRDAVERYYTPVTVNSHPVSFATYSQPLIERNWKTAGELGVPIISGDRWLSWTEAREAITLRPADSTLEVTAGVAIDAVTVLLPNGWTASDARAERLWQRDYRMVTLRDVGAGETRIVRLDPL